MTKWWHNMVEDVCICGSFHFRTFQDVLLVGQFYRRHPRDWTNRLHSHVHLWNLIGGLEHFLFFHTLGMSSSQLTFIFFRGVGQPPTRNCVAVQSLSVRLWGSLRALALRLYPLCQQSCFLQSLCCYRPNYESKANLRSWKTMLLYSIYWTTARLIFPDVSWDIRHVYCLFHIQDVCFFNALSA